MQCLQKLADHVLICKLGLMYMSPQAQKPTECEGMQHAGPGQPVISARTECSVIKRNHDYLAQHSTPYTGQLLYAIGALEQVH
jgi:hypothetical protein